MSEHFHLPIDELLHQKPTRFIADFSGFGAKTSSLEYLNILEKELADLKKEKNVKVWYITSGLPDFYFFYFESLTIFKSFIWERMVWGNEHWQRRDFKLNIPEKKVIFEKANKLVGYYNFIHTTEIWNEELLDSLFRQLLYVTESRIYGDKEDIIKVCEDIEKLIYHLEEMAYTERHFSLKAPLNGSTAPFYLYYNDTMQNNIFLLMENASRREVYSVLNTPNFIKTNNPQMTDYMYIQVQRLLKRSVPLGKSGEKYRRIYFDELKYRFKNFQKKIMLLFGKNNGLMLEKHDWKG